MWKVLKAELRYHKTAIIALYVIGVLFLMATLLSDLMKSMDAATETWIWMSVVASSYIFLLIHIGSYNDTEKWDRLHALLPIPRLKLGVARLALMLLFQAGVGIIWLIAVMAVGKGRDLAYLGYMLSVNAFFFQTVALIAIFLDLGHFGRNTYRWRLAGVGALLMILIIWLTLAGKIISVLEYIVAPYTTPVSAAIFVLIAAGLFYLDVVIYTCRKSYLK